MSGSCASRVVVCRLDGQDGSVASSNWCGSPQEKCPRLPGEDYTKCKTVCKQEGHAEINALGLAKQMGYCMEGGIASVTGHYFVCRDCAEALRAAGIKKIVVQEKVDGRP